MPNMEEHNVKDLRTVNASATSTFNEATKLIKQNSTQHHFRWGPKEATKNMSS